RIRDLLMGQTLYEDSTLALRELYQNALDACRYRRARTEYLQHQPNSLGITPYEGKIVFRQGTTRDGRPVIECQDNGVGMTERMLAQVFAVAGRRFHDEPAFLEELGRWKRSGIEFYPNSQHGIGVLSYFMLADEIEVETRAYDADGRKGAPLRVRVSTVSGLFHIMNANENLEYGTRVRLYLNKETFGNQQHTTSAVSAAKVLRELLLIAEFPTEVYADALEPDGMRLVGTLAHRWEPGVPHLQKLQRTSPIAICPTDMPDVWWADNNQCPVLADGIRTDATFPFALVNLRGGHYPRLSANRLHIVGKWDQAWVLQCLERSTVRLSELETLSLMLLFQIFAKYPDALTHWEALVRRRDTVPFFSGDQVPQPITSYRGTLPERVSLQTVGWMPPDMDLLSPPSEPLVHAFAAWRYSVWDGGIGVDWPKLHAPNPRLDQGAQPPVLELGFLLKKPSGLGLAATGRVARAAQLIHFPTGSPRHIADLVPRRAAFSHQIIQAPHWAEACLGLPIVGLAEGGRRRDLEQAAESSPLPDLDEVDQHLISLVRKGSSLLTLVSIATVSVSDFDNLTTTAVFARLRKLASFLNPEQKFGLEALLEAQLDEKDAWLITRYRNERWTGEVIPATHVLYAARDLKMTVADVATRWIKLAPLLSLKAGFEVDTLARAKLEQHDWQFLSQDLDQSPLEEGSMFSLVSGSYSPAPWLFGSVPAAHVLYASHALRIPAADIVARLRELAAPLRLSIQFDADALATVDLSAQDWTLLTQSSREHGRWLSEVTAADVVNAAHEVEEAVTAVVARLAELSEPMRLTLRPCVRFLREQAFEALANAVAERSVQVPYDGFDARRCAERWVLQAGTNVNEGVEDPERALLCAGRWWLWWLTDETLREIGSSLLPAVIAELERKPVR
ncbi:MAG TPA: hypothetical protein VNM90_27570, partial [Haliangium sp.]|nr:hypothetical protein [Haliangium sp.]